MVALNGDFYYNEKQDYSRYGVNMETKSEIRKRILAMRSNLSDEDFNKKSGIIVQKVLQTAEYKEAVNILLYADYCREVMTRGIFDDAVLHKKMVYLPKVDTLTNTMEFYRVTSTSQLARGYKGIPEPEENLKNIYRLDKNEDTLAVIPGVAFDTQGYRLGYGKGFYDKYLSNKRQISTIALAFSCQILDELPHEAHDIKMDKVVTEEIIIHTLRV